MRRTHIISIIVCLVSIGAIVSFVRARAEQADEQKVRQLLTASGAGNTGKLICDQMMANFRKSLPNVPADFWDDFQKETRPESFVELVVPVYQKHFTSAEIDQLIAFYQSPIGQKLVKEQPAIVQESMAAGQQWGQQIAQKLMQKLREKGINPK